MKESIGFTVSLNIMIVFITVVIAFLCASLIYFKSHKVSNIITSAIEKYEGYNVNSEREINLNLSSLGYGSHNISCGPISDTELQEVENCSLEENGINGYCVYKCTDNTDYYYYKIRTNMMINIPIINNVLDVPIWTTTNRLYDFTK